MRTKVGLVSLSLLAGLAASTQANAQGVPPPPGPAQPQPPGPSASPPGPPPAAQPSPAPPQPSAQPTPGAPTAQPYGQQPAADPYGQQPGPYAQPAPGTDPTGAGFSASAGVDDAGFDAEADGEGDDEEPKEDDYEYRKGSLNEQNSLNAATGLMRVYSATSGAPGTFRFSLGSSYFSGSGFLCPSCEVPDGGDPSQEDEATRIGAQVGISATLASFFEAYFGVHNHASTNTLGRPQLLQVLGDMNLGVKGFMPHKPDQIFSAGGALELWLLNGTGSVGIGGASYALRAMATADLHNRSNEEDRLPLRFHANLGYRFDNSGRLVEDVETQRQDPISRIERFGLGINRVDSFQIGLGAEGVWSFIRPFIEWTIDVPVNRQDYICDLSDLSAGDDCLGNSAGFSTTPSRFSLGARVYPWFDGLALMLGFDIGTGATSTFVEEIAPEVPWNFHFGLAYAADTKPATKIERVEVDSAPPLPDGTVVTGQVVEKGTDTPVPDAIIRFEGLNLTGMVAMSDGRFQTNELDPGTYTFSVSAAGYRDGQCTATVATPFAAGAAGPGTDLGAPDTAPAGPIYDQYGQPVTPTQPAPAYDQYGQPIAPAQPAPAYDAYGQPIPQPNAQPGATPGQTASVKCELEPLPKVGNVEGTLRDADGDSPIGGATVKITDKLNRSLTLTSDGSGAFRFENVPPGVVTITVDAPGYMRSATELEVQAQEDTRTQLSLNKRPAKPNVVVTNKEIKLKEQVHFQHNSAEILPDSHAILEEIADVLRERGEISSVEIQGHTDDSGTPAYNQRLSTERANAVRDALTKLGVDGSRLTARGYGQEKPLVPNTSEANRSRNRRVQLMIQK